MPKQSALFYLYKERLGCCQTSEELVRLSREISTANLKDAEKTALCVSCVAIAKYFDRQAKKAARGNKHENS